MLRVPIPFIRSIVHATKDLKEMGKTVEVYGIFCKHRRNLSK